VSSLDNCPTCGRLAGYSLLGDHLRDAESTWTKKQMLGIALAMAAYAILTVWDAIQLTALADPKAVYVDTAFLKFFLALAGWLTFLVGAVILATPETSGSLLSRRRGVAATLVASTILYILVGLAPKRYFLEFAKEIGLITKIIVSSLAFVVGQSVVWIHLRRLIDRTPRRELSRLLMAAFWLSIPLNLLLCEGSFMLLGGMKNHQRLIVPGLIGLYAIGILKSIVAILLLMMTRKGIRRTVGYWDN